MNKPIVKIAFLLVSRYGQGAPIPLSYQEKLYLTTMIIARVKTKFNKQLILGYNYQNDSGLFLWF